MMDCTAKWSSMTLSFTTPDVAAGKVVDAEPPSDGGRANAWPGCTPWDACRK